MKILALADNALFMRYWHSQGRLGRLIPKLAMAFLVSALVLIGCYLSSLPSGFANPYGRPEWPRIALGIILSLQAVALLLIGTWGAGNAAYNEVATGTMDFHRASATSPANQALGLVLGPTASSYLYFAAMLPAGLLCVVLGAVRLLDFAGVVVSLLLTSVFFQVMAAAMGLRLRKKPTVGAQQGAGGAVVVILICLVAIPLSYSPWSLIGSLTSYPVIAIAMGETKVVRSAFFGVHLPPLLLQALVQAPLIALAAAALRRAVAYPTRPALSKRLSLALAFWLFLLLVCAAADVLGRKTEANLGTTEGGALIFAFVFGGVAAYAATPSYALFSNRLRRRKKLNLTGAAPFEDGAGNSAWALSYAALVAVMSVGVMAVAPRWLLLLSLGAMLLSFGWCAAALESYRLGAGRGKGAVLPVVIIMLWIVLPAFALITQSASGSEWMPWASWLMSPCPLFGIGATAAFGSGSSMAAPPADRSTAAVVLIVNGALFVFFTWLAWSARRSAARRALAEYPGPAPAAVPSR